mgnify:CR=1 FL=1
MSDVIIPEGDFVEIVNRYISTLLVIVLLTSKGVQN